MKTHMKIRGEKRTEEAQLIIILIQQENLLYPLTAKRTVVSDGVCDIYILREKLSF